ncbi:MAG: DUF6290 family protein [Bacteroides sp.]|nr:DUF6290 family protein [Eubacterium sp.]MCM1418104.1 DUF6290 family protein [Roseburia sp.]MCM1462272.1 DUF6290 family protein [Bacteroides sp.]
MPFSEELTEEDEYDLAVYEKAYQEYLNSGEKSRSIEELWRELGI